MGIELLISIVCLYMGAFLFSRDDDVIYPIVVMLHDVGCNLHDGNHASAGRAFSKQPERVSTRAQKKTPTLRVVTSVTATREPSQLLKVCGLSRGSRPVTIIW